MIGDLGRSLVPGMNVAGCLPIFTVGIAREVVVLLSFSVNLSRKPEFIKSIPMFQNDEPKGFISVCGYFSKHV